MSEPQTSRRNRRRNRSRQEIATKCVKAEYELAGIPLITDVDDPKISKFIEVFPDQVQYMKEMIPDAMILYIIAALKFYIFYLMDGEDEDIELCKRSDETVKIAAYTLTFAMPKLLRSNKHARDITIFNVARGMVLMMKEVSGDD
jgi:hypothetical protein